VRHDQRLNFSPDFFVFASGLEKLFLLGRRQYDCGLKESFDFFPPLGRHRFLPHPGLPRTMARFRMAVMLSK
jgi:hypothetical protein